MSKRSAFLSLLLASIVLSSSLLGQSVTHPRLKNAPRMGAAKLGENLRKLQAQLKAQEAQLARLRAENARLAAENSNLRLQRSILTGKLKAVEDKVNPGLRPTPYRPDRSDTGYQRADLVTMSK